MSEGCEVTYWTTQPLLCELNGMNKINYVFVVSESDATSVAAFAHPLAAPASEH